MCCTAVLYNVLYIHALGEKFFKALDNTDSVFNLRFSEKYL